MVAESATACCIISYVGVLVDAQELDNIWSNSPILQCVLCCDAESSRMMSLLTDSLA